MSRKQNQLLKWQAVMDEWRASGQTQAAFCASRNLSVWTLRTYSKAIARAKRSTNAPVTMVEIKPAPSVVDSEPNFDPSTLVRIIFPNQIVFEQTLPGSGNTIETMLRLIKTL